MYGHLRKALSRNKQTSVHLRLIFPSTNQEDMQQRWQAWAWFPATQRPKLALGFVLFLIPDTHSWIWGMRSLRETFKSRAQQPDEMFQQPDEMFRSPELQKVKHHQLNGIAPKSNHFLPLQTCSPSSLVLEKKADGQAVLNYQLLIWISAHQVPASSASHLFIFFPSEWPSALMIQQDQLEPVHHNSAIMSPVSWSWWDTREGNRLHDNQATFGFLAQMTTQFGAKPELTAPAL